LPPGTRSQTLAAKEAADAAAEKARTDPPQEPSTSCQSTQQMHPETVWMSCTDADGDTYYYNSSGETVWELPPGGRVAQPGEDVSQATATASSGMNNSAPQTSVFQSSQPPQQSYYGQTQSNWTTCQTAEGQFYYYNSTTGESSWEVPPDFADDMASADPDVMDWNWGGQGGVWPHGQPQQYMPQDPWQQQQYMQQPTGQDAPADKAFETMYAQHWAWFKQQQEQQKAQGMDVSNAPAPPALDAGIEEQLAYAMKLALMKELEAMYNDSASKRKKAFRNLQAKWHPDKNPEQLEVAKSVFQFIGEKRTWFLYDDGNEGEGEFEVDPLD